MAWYIISLYTPCNIDIGVQIILNMNLLDFFDSTYRDITQLYLFAKNDFGQKVMHFPRFQRHFLDPSFLVFLSYLLIFETNIALKVAIKHVCPMNTLSSRHFKTVGSPWPLSPERTVEEHKHLVILRISRACPRQGGNFLEWKWHR